MAFHMNLAGLGGGRRSEARSLRDLDAVNDQLFAIRRGKRSRPGLKAAPAIFEFHSRAGGKVHATVFAVKQRGEGSSRVILRPGLNGSIGYAGQRLDHQRRAALGQHIEQIRRGLLRRDGQRLLEQNRAGVEALFEQHGGVAGEGIAYGPGPLEGRGAAVPGQQRSVQVYAAQPRQRQHPGRNQASVGDDDDGVRSEGFKLRAKLGVVANLFRLRDRQASGQGGLLDGRSSKLLAATHGPVGLRNNQRNLVARRKQCLQRGHGEAGGPAKNHFRRTRHAVYHSPARCILRILRRARSRLRALMRKMNNMPSTWSISCWKQRESRSSPSISNHLPFSSWARTRTLAWRTTFSRISRKLRQPSSS